MPKISSYYDWDTYYHTLRVEFKDIMELERVAEYLTIAVINHEGDLQNAHWAGETVKHPMGFNVYFVTVRYVLKRNEPYVASHRSLY